MSWVLYALAALLLFDAVRMRRRIGALTVLAPSDEPTSHAYRIVAAPGDVQGLALAVQSPTPTGGAPSASPTPSSTCEQADKSDTVQVVAQGIAFTPDTSCIEVPAGTPFTIHFDNKDAATQHDIAIFPDDSMAKVLFRGDLVTGVATVKYDVPALPAGTYKTYFNFVVFIGQGIFGSASASSSRASSSPARAGK